MNIRVAVARVVPGHAVLGACKCKRRGRGPMLVIGDPDIVADLRARGRNPREKYLIIDKAPVGPYNTELAPRDHEVRVR